MGGPRWGKKELNVLKTSYGVIPARVVATKIGRSKDAVIKKASKLGLAGFRRKVINYPPSRELSYIIGAVKGDGCVYINKHKHGNGYCIALGVKDLEFVSEFRDNIGRLLGRSSKIHRVKNRLQWIFFNSICDKSLFMILKKPITELEDYIEAYPTDFLRGFFDAEGSASVRPRRRFAVKYCNTDLELLDYVRKLLVKLAIFPSPSTHKAKGTSKPCYHLSVYRKDSVRRFMSLIGSSIPRKNLVV